MIDNRVFEKSLLFDFFAETDKVQQFKHTVVLSNFFDDFLVLEIFVPVLP